MVNGFSRNVVLQAQQYTYTFVPFLLSLSCLQASMLLLLAAACTYLFAAACIVQCILLLLLLVKYSIPHMHLQSPRLPLPIYGSTGGNIWKCSLPDYMLRDKMYALKMVKVGWQNMVRCYVVVSQTTFCQQAPVVMTDYPVFSQTTMVAPVPVVSQSTTATKKGDFRLPLVLSFNGRGKLHRSVLPVSCSGES